MDYEPLDLSFDDFPPMDFDEDFFNNVYFEELQWSTSHQIGQCVSGCFSSVQYTIGKLLLVTLLQRLITILDFPVVIKHLSSISLGLIILPEWVQREDIRIGITVAIPILVLFLLLTPFPSKGVAALCACISLIVFIQNIIPAKDFLAVRGILMVLAMKISSLAFDKVSDCTSKDAVPILAYLFSPATLVFGPFHTFDDYVKSLSRRTIKEELSSGLFSAALIGTAFCFLVYSSCSSIILPEGSMLNDYFVAQSFRTSHYFVCTLSQALALLAGMRLSVTSPLVMEVPFSLVEVVVAWNIPMHKFLHTYVYSKFLRLGHAFSVLASFAVSSLLHGVNFQISAVLLSLGFACYFENVLRNRISLRFSMCVRARPCRTCNHEKKSGSWQALLINALFFVCAVYQLIYLGAPFDGEGAEIGYEMSHTIAIWRRHRFFGHCISVVIALCSSFI